MTVAELRAALADFPDDMLVLSEGCDCRGDAHSVRLTECDNEDETAKIKVALVSRCRPAERCEWDIA